MVVVVKYAYAVTVGEDGHHEVAGWNPMLGSLGEVALNLQSPILSPAVDYEPRQVEQAVEHVHVLGGVTRAEADPKKKRERNKQVSAHSRTREPFCTSLR